MYRLTPSRPLKTGGNGLTDDCLQPPPPPPSVMGQQQSSKVHKTQSGSKSTPSLNRVSRLFQPGLKGQRASGSNSATHASRGEDAAANPPATDEVEPEIRPAGTAEDQVCDLRNARPHFAHPCLIFEPHHNHRYKTRTSCHPRRPSPVRYPTDPPLFLILTLISPYLSRSQYRTGKTLGSGTYAIVKEAVHIKTGIYYACKVINKKLMEGREHMVDSLF